MDSGLASREAQLRLSRFGGNQLKAARRRRMPAILVDQFRSVVVLLLLAAGTLAYFFADPVESLAIFVVVAINSAIGFFVELHATRSMQALREIGRVQTIVLRDGKRQRLRAEELVPGDIVLFEGGDIITADMRLLEAARLTADESTLTGESLPVTKSADPLPPDTELMDRRNMLFKGSSITRGSGTGVVVATGLHTELGRISELVLDAGPGLTPLERRLNALAGRLVWLVLVIAVLIAGGGVMAGRDVFLAVEVAIALAVAAIPEGLPIVATIALARGMWRMARRNALVARLSAVETLGATSIIVTDKTGTLTENRMTVTTAELATGTVHIGARQADVSAGELALLDELLVAGVLCNNASLGNGDSTGGIGDPTEVALLVAAKGRGLGRAELLADWPEIGETPFDPELKLMATVHGSAQEALFAVKGAPEAILAICSSVRRDSAMVPLDDTARAAWLARAAILGERGLRTLAFATKRAAGTEQPYSGLTFLGILGIEDPPRADVPDAIARCRDAGIAVIMVTGDHAATARNIAIETGIVAADTPAWAFAGGEQVSAQLREMQPGHTLRARVVSRATPEQKLDLIDHFQARGHVVAMTGDGVNDAPALSKADIGVAMGKRGTDVAKEAAAMVLQDDAFGTIVEAVAQGRNIFENIRKFVVYLMSCNLSELLIVGLATMAGAPLPLLPLQILFLNLVTDVFPALALGVGKGTPELMRSAPRPTTEGVVTRQQWIRIFWFGASITVAVLAAMALAIFWLGLPTGRAVTVSFCTLALAQLWHVFNMRSEPGALFNNEITRNGWVWAAIGCCLVLIAAVVWVPPLAEVLSLQDPGPAGWFITVTMSLMPVAMASLMPNLFHRRERRPAATASGTR